jgi:hypothetical protein
VTIASCFHSRFCFAGKKAFILLGKINDLSNFTSHLRMQHKDKGGIELCARMTECLKSGKAPESKLSIVLRAPELRERVTLSKGLPAQALVASDKLMS